MHQNTIVDGQRQLSINVIRNPDFSLIIGMYYSFFSGKCKKSKDKKPPKSTDLNPKNNKWYVRVYRWLS
jgi:hypothetical protein